MVQKTKKNPVVGPVVSAITNWKLSPNPLAALWEGDETWGQGSLNIQEGPPKLQGAQSVPEEKVCLQEGLLQHPEALQVLKQINRQFKAYADLGQTCYKPRG